MGASREPQALGLAWQINERFPLTTHPSPLPVVDIDQRLLCLVHRNALSNACKYGRHGGVVATEVVLAGDQLTIRVVNEPGEQHESVRGLDPASVFAKGTRLHRVSSDEAIATARVSKGDGGWVMAKCAECMLGECSIAFREAETVFELRCPAPQRLEESFLDEADLSAGVTALAIDDCEFQLVCLEAVFASLGIPEESTTLIGTTDEEVKGAADTIVAAVEALPPDGRLLLIVDENLDLAFPSSETVSGSYAARTALNRMPPSEEARTLVLVRSANDSESDVALYNERTHGFLSKAPSEPDRRTVLRTWVTRFGCEAVTRKGAPARSAADSAQLDDEDEMRAAAAAELRRLVALIGAERASAPWCELWKWLHRLKGALGSSRALGCCGADELIRTIESLRSRGELEETVWSLIERGSLAIAPSLVPGT